ncbi:hypothetical protein [Emticicia sp. 17c]|uniref:hypothetical protein n=1 Tax=Emticicia sp. 17c TaxID=3127704 RepID=UPI00301DDB70
MKKIFYYIVLLGVGMLADACTIKKFSSNRLFYKALHDEKMDYEGLKEIVKDSEKTVDEYSDTSTNMALVEKLHKFDEGAYMVKILETETSVAPERIKTVSKFPHQKNAEEIPVQSESKMRKDTILATVFKVNDSVKIDSASKIIYLVFLDNNRVLFHSPYRKKLLKKGNDSLDLKNHTYKIKKPVGFVRETEEFFKLGSDYEYNSVMRGYYKIDSKRGLSIWLETYVESEKLMGKKKMVITRLNFRYVQSGNKIESLRFKSASFRDTFINVDQTFEKFGEEGIEFKFHPESFKLLLTHNNQIHIISKIKQTGNEREYFSVNSYDCTENCKKINQVILKETPENPLTY